MEAPLSRGNAQGPGRVSPTVDVPAPVVSAILAKLEAGDITDKAGLQRVKHNLAREHGLPSMPQDADILNALPQDARDRWRHVLRTKPMRTGSGVAIVAVMSSPAGCPHGKCIYCPGGPEVDAPQSYTGFEPSTMRAKRFAYDPYRNVRHRLGQLHVNGHSIDKVDVVVQGGTFPARSQAYQDWFIHGIYAACNDGPDVEAADPGDAIDDWAAMGTRERDHRLEAAMQANESAACRVIGLTVETKPDWCLEPHVDAMLRHGTTRVELGVQTLDEEVTRLTNRGHTVQDAADAMRISRDAGLKVCVHMMPGLPRPDPERPGHYRTDPDADVEDVRRLFAEEAWRPDMLKIYPTLVVEEGETPLKRWWKDGRYRPYDTAEAADVVARCLALVPPTCRVQRVDRDIPTTHVVAGVQNTNLRQIAEKRAQEEGLVVREIRGREVHRRTAAGAGYDGMALRDRAYQASGGQERFISLEDPDTDALAGFIRVRRVSRPHRSEFDDPAGAAVVRELKIYGTAQALGEHDPAAWQHQGLGARLLDEAERVAFSEWGCGRLLVIAGVGVKAYYRRHGYRDLGPYVVKSP